MNDGGAVLHTVTEGHRSLVFDEFVLGRRPVYVNAAYLKLGSLDDAREAANETFFKLHLKWDEALASESTSAFAWTILKGVIADMLRKRDRRPCMPAGLMTFEEGLAFEPTVRAISGIPSDEIEQMPRRIVVHEAIAALPDRQRTCIKLHYLSGHTAEEIADSIGLTASTVRSHLASGREALAKALNEPEAAEDGQKGVTP
ncbi:RNA polymerase sigma factor [Streptomyces sp. 8N706]|uniref:RNA polymerase sigma factor n=1 Tax=Streptomyces sp. 8N706 TaxID=3457416 RepID=UPI003FCF6E46